MLFSNYEYDPMGNRLCKIVKPRPSGSATNQNFWTFTWYIRDAQGNIMATYLETHFADDDDYYACLTASEMPIYGSSRLSVQKAYDTLSVIQYVNQTFDADSFYTSTYDTIPILVIFVSGVQLERKVVIKPARKPSLVRYSY